MRLTILKNNIEELYRKAPTENVEEYLKNNIGFLRQRFEEEDIPYSQLSYSQHQQQEKRQQQENNKENKHE